MKKIVSPSKLIMATKMAEFVLKPNNYNLSLNKIQDGVQDGSLHEVQNDTIKLL